MCIRDSFKSLGGNRMDITHHKTGDALEFGIGIGRGVQHLGSGNARAKRRHRNARAFEFLGQGL